MRTLATLLLTIGLQLALASVACVAAMAVVARDRRGVPRKRRRETAIRARAAATLAHALPLAVLLGLGGAALQLALGAELRGLTAVAGPSGLLLIGTVATAGASLVLHAARLEAAARLRIARRQIRFGGQLMFVGVLGLLAWLAADLMLRAGVGHRPPGAGPLATWLPALGGISLAFSAAAALLAGLSGKARPSAGVAVLLYLLGLAAALAVAPPVPGH